MNEGEQRKGRKEENEQKRKRKDSRERKERHPERKKEKHSESYLKVLKLTKLNIIILAMLGTLRDKKKHISRMTERSTNKARCRVACLRLTSLIDKQ